MLFEITVSHAPKKGERRGWQFSFYVQAENADAAMVVFRESKGHYCDGAAQITCEPETLTVIATSTRRWDPK